MHEMSLVVSLLDIVRQEMKSNGAKKLVRVRVRCGVLVNVAPEALRMAFAVQTMDTDLAGARLELVEEPLRLACGACAREFTPVRAPVALFSPCPACGEEIGHRVLAGKELFVERIEMEQDEDGSARHP
jgi:hydrogenase nickel incorporation protein HypA/HybF